MVLAVEQTDSSRRRPLRVALTVLCAMALLGATLLALRHGPSPNPEVLLPQATTTVTCQETITVSIIVGNDLSCPGSSGLIAGASGIIINLNGHTLAGNTSNEGVVINGVYSGVAVENGTVSGWDFGVESFGPGTKVTGIKAANNSTAGILFSSGSALSSATGNVVFGGGGFGISASGLNDHVTSNVVRESHGPGIVVDGSGQVVQGNQVENSGTGGAGIADSGAGNTLIGNVTDANTSDGINSTVDPTATVTSNTANYNGSYGIEGSPGGKDGGGNTAKGNTQATQCKDIACA